MYDVKKELFLEAVEVANTLGKVGLEYFRNNEVPCYKSGIVVKHWNNRKRPHDGQGTQEEAQEMIWKPFPLFRIETEIPSPTSPRFTDAMNYYLGTSIHHPYPSGPIHWPDWPQRSFADTYTEAYKRQQKGTDDEGKRGKENN